MENFIKCAEVRAKKEFCNTVYVRGKCTKMQTKKSGYVFQNRPDSCKMDGKFLEALSLRNMFHRRIDGTENGKKSVELIRNDELHRPV